jgi:DNA mismatch repair protein MutS
MNPNPPQATPMIQQYLAIKGEHPDAILFYRMGDFYEMFFEDAETASRALDITLTSRNKKDESPVPMCGVPYRAASGYIARLIDQGFKVAVCDQVEDPAAAKGLVRREVVRVITPGMIVDDQFLDARAPNFIGAFLPGEAGGAFAYLDISTGLFRVIESDDAAALADEIRRVGPRELLLPEALRADPAAAKRCGPAAVAFIEDRLFEHRRAYDRLRAHFGTLTLEGFGCEGLRRGVGAAGALLHHVLEAQKQSAAHITRLEPYSLAECLVVDETSRQNLELTRNLNTGTRRGSLLGVIDLTRTPMGARRLLAWLRHPLRAAEPILERQAAVAEAQEKSGVRRALRDHLKSVYDLERLGAKTVMGQANARDLVALKQSLMMLPALWGLAAEMRAALFAPPPLLAELSGLADLIDGALREDAPPVLNEGGLIKPGFNAELDELVRISSDAKGFLAQLEVAERERTGIAALKVSFNKVFGYYIEVPKARAGQVPTHYVRKQTLVNAERYITDELKGFELKVTGAEEKRAQLEQRLFEEIRAEVVARHARIQEAAGFIAQLDALLALAEVAEQNGYCRPEIRDDGVIRIEEGRHPVVEKMISGERYVPNSIALDDDENQVLIITGPNMAGKSTVLRQVALTVILAQMGGFVPARAASVALVDRIFTRVGALDNLSQGQSTFMVEMQETANILNNATGRSLVILDEIGRGTSTFDGLSIAWAVAEYLHDLEGRGVKTLFATHYHELTELAGQKPRVKNFHIAVKEWNDEIIFLRKLVPGGTNRSYGIQVARLAGLPPAVIDRARKILFRIENGGRGSRGPAASSKSARPQPQQLGLFDPAASALAERIASLDLGAMTPLAALNLLHELQGLAGRRQE